MATLGLLICGALSDALIEKCGTYEDFFTRDLSRAEPSLSFKSYNVYEDEFPTSPFECDAWLVSGSSSGVYEDKAWIAKLFDFIRAAYEADVALVGICFGHQAIAQALGGQVVKADVGWGLGFQKYRLLSPFGDIKGDTLDLYAIHQDQVVVCPPDANVVATSDHCPIAALIYNKSAVSFQAHPEFTREFELDLIASLRGERFSEDFADQALENVKGTHSHNDAVMSFIAQFVTQER